MTALTSAYCAAPLHAEPGKGAAPACSRALKVTISPIGRSMMVSPNGAVSGIVRDFLELVSQQFGCTFELLVVPRARAFVMLASGEIDIVPSVNRTELRDQTGKFVDVYDKRPMLIALKGPQASSVPDLLRGTTSIGVVRGYDYGQAYTALLDARS